MFTSLPECPRCGHPDMWPDRMRAAYRCDACDFEITEQELLELPHEPDKLEELRDDDAE